MGMFYRNKYRIPSIRLSGHDYSSPGWYFITVCTRGRYPWFGYIHNGIMCVNDFGSLVYRYWYDIPNHYDHVILDTFIVMPDHIHGILRIVNKRHNDFCRDAINRVSTEGISSNSGGITKHMNPMITGKSLSNIVRTYKARITFNIHTMGNDEFAWQPNYYERIIRSERELYATRQYIRNNPVH